MALRPGNPFRRPEAPPPLSQRRSRVSPYRRAQDFESAHILRYLRSNQTQPEVDRESEAILDWLFTPKKKVRASGQRFADPVTSKGNNS